MQEKKPQELELALLEAKIAYFNAEYHTLEQLQARNAPQELHAKHEAIFAGALHAFLEAKQAYTNAKIDRTTAFQRE